MPNSGSLVTNKQRSGLNSGLDVLELLARFRDGATLTAIARESGMSKSGVHGLLATLSRRGFVARADDGCYALGIRAWELGASTPQFEFTKLVTPHVDRLVREVQEGAIVGVLHGVEVVYVHLVEGPQRVRVHASPGDRIPVHCTSTGLAMLAARSDAEVTAMLPPKLPSITSETITSRAELLKELHRIRMRGYAIGRGGWQIDVGGAAVALPWPHPPACAALCVAAPRYRVTKAWLARVGEALIAAAARMARDLGARGSDASGAALRAAG